jgi:hypothetical protein
VQALAANPQGCAKANQDPARVDAALRLHRLVRADALQRGVDADAAGQIQEDLGGGLAALLDDVAGR